LALLVLPSSWGEEQPKKAEAGGACPAALDDWLEVELLGPLSPPPPAPPVSRRLSSGGAGKKAREVLWLLLKQFLGGAIEKGTGDEPSLAWASALTPSL